MNKLRIPQVGEYERNIGKLIAVETVKPPPPETFQEYIFETIESRCELRFNGEVIKTLQTLNDFYGIGTGEITAIEEMKQYAINKNITDKSELEVVVVRVISQTRLRPVNRENLAAKGYTDFEYLPYGCKRGLPDDIETVAWSSKYFTQEAVDKFIKEHILPTK